MTQKEERFKAIIAQYENLIAKVVRSYCHDSAEYPDLSQEIMIQLWQTRAILKELKDL